MASCPREALTEPKRSDYIRERLALAVRKTHPVVVSTWPAQAGRSLAAMSGAAETTVVAELATESSKLLRSVERSLTDGMEDRSAGGANARYEWLGAVECGAAPGVNCTAALVGLRRSLINSVWALVQPELSADLPSDEVALAHDVLIRTARRSLGIPPELMT